MNLAAAILSIFLVARCLPGVDATNFSATADPPPRVEEIRQRRSYLASKKNAAERTSVVSGVVYVFPVRGTPAYRYIGIQVTMKGPFSAVSKSIFAARVASCIIFSSSTRLARAPLQAQYVQISYYFATSLLRFRNGKSHSSRRMLSAWNRGLGGT